MKTKQKKKSNTEDQTPTFSMAQNQHFFVALDIDTVLSEAFLQNKEVTIQLNLLDEYGRILDDLSGHFKGEAYQDYFVFNDQIIHWDDVRNIEIVTQSKWFDLDMFESSEENKRTSTTPSEVVLEKDDYYQPFFEEGENN